MIVVSDTSAITSLIQVGQEQILAKLFAQVIIPPAVRDELFAFHGTIPSFLQVVSVKGLSEVKSMLVELDRGEAEAIALAEEKKADYVLIDDLAARKVAIGKGLPVIGLIGVLIKARKAGEIAALDDLLDDLEKLAGFRISSELRRQALAAAGE